MIGVGTLNGNSTDDTAHFTTSALPIGDDTITADYLGSATTPPSFLSSSSNPIIETVTAQVATTITLTDIDTTSGSPDFDVAGRNVPGDTVLLTATVHSTVPVPAGSSPPTGTVSFYAQPAGFDANNTYPLNPAYLIGTSPVGANGSATLSTTTFVASGSPYDVEAVFNPAASTNAGQPTYASSNTESDESGLTQFVNGQDSFVVLSETPNPSQVGQPVVLTAKVTAVGPLQAGVGAPTGTVTFYSAFQSHADTEDIIGTATIDATGTATFTAPPGTFVDAFGDTTGSWTIAAVYSGDNQYKSAHDTDFEDVLTASTSTVVTVNPFPAAVDQTEVVTATVSTPFGQGPNGTVWWYASPLNNSGTTPPSSIILVPTGAGFGGPGAGGNGGDSTGARSGNDGDGTGNGGNAGAGGAGGSTGGGPIIIPFTPNSPLVLIGNSNLNFNSTSSATATLGFTASSTGAFIISAYYSPDGELPVIGADGSISYDDVSGSSATPSSEDYAPSNGAVTVRVNNGSTTTTLTSSTTTATTATDVTFTATVASGTGTATGNVKFFSGSTLIGTVALNQGSPDTATLITTLPAGTDNITAVYAGDTNFAGSTSAIVTVTVAGLTVQAASLTTTSGAVLARNLRQLHLQQCRSIHRDN